MPGYGVVRQSANAQAARGTTAAPPCTPVGLSLANIVNVAACSSTSAGG